MPKTNTEQNKETVIRLFKIIYGSVQDIPLIDELVTEDYVQHNPRAGQGREGLRELLYKIVPEPKELNPAGTLTVNLIAEGDYVVRQEIRTDGMLVDIFRMKDGMCQEHWDAFRFAPGAARIPGF
jgi:predicted SnoaL-like aldol condensation-catalyzing enzyme